MVSGALLATAAIVTGLVSGANQLSVAGALLAQPALVTVPIAFAVMITVSLWDPVRVPGLASAEMLALHAPEGLGLRLADDELTMAREVGAGS
jgi:hypothetical protein